MRNVLLQKNMAAEQHLMMNSEIIYKKKSKVIAYLLWYFFGLIGGHRYYIGDIGIGIAMTLTGGGGGIWWLYDVVKIGKRVEAKNLEMKLKWEQENIISPERRHRMSEIHEVDAMTGEGFEEFLQNLLIKRGYKVELTPKTGDYGADLILTINSKKIAVQAKRYKDKVGIKAVQEIVSAKSIYSAEECWVITNSYFTNQAAISASSNKVILIDRNQLIEWMIEETEDEKMRNRFK